MSTYRRLLRVGTMIAAAALWFVAGGIARAVDPPAHWSYLQPVRSALPETQDRRWVRNAVDAFILARLEREGVASSPPADRARLIRRVYLDLIGLPPPVHAVDAFVRSTDPAAYPQLVDSLLASPHYGERWATSWLDQARYADSNGYQADQFRSVWPYRDWVIRAMNADMPFDRFTIEQVAGDLLPDATLDQQIATGFHRLTTCNVEAGVDPEQNRVNQIIDRVNTTGTVWLGTTLECAQCHDHKYDPFSQQDYYHFFAYFNNTPIEVEGDGVTFDFVGPKMDLPMPREKETRREALQQESESQREAFETRLADLIAGLDQVDVPEKVAKVLGMEAGKRNENQTKQLEDHAVSLDPELKELRDRLAKLNKEIRALQPTTTLVMVEQAERRESHIFHRGDFLDPRDPVQPAVPAALHAVSGEFGDTRLGLARWLVDPANPLTARVVVNRWWAEMFGHGIVATSEDFGTQGEPPTHPHLLDYLACELVESGWSMKHVHRLIVTSATYQQSARVDDRLLARDPNNQLYARGPRFRLSAEAIRDNALAISGLLSNKMGGAPVYPPQPPDHWRHVGRNAPKFATSKGGDRYRRGVYVIWRRSAPYPSFTNFDAPDRTSCIVARSRTNTPLQALTLLNDQAYIELAIGLARRMADQPPEVSIEKKIAFGFRLCVAREPRTAEVEHLSTVYQNELDRLRQAPNAVKALVKGQGVDSDGAAELAAWFYVASILLNLDETVTKG